MIKKIERKQRAEMRIKGQRERSHNRNTTDMKWTQSEVIFFKKEIEICLKGLSIANWVGQHGPVSQEF